ncbi:hypothetical protein SADUNF_Sadunf19G0023100 [Salix dunnii]|uniref:Uncharacterized protein n=1 Tax=Salix dunnii TaxID=1413687 RepID=A0A835J1I8_9ROSI|nr:hypothetical protein SADUNF_Sadunf19G0023100 [Salix dunnii]
MAQGHAPSYKEHADWTANFPVGEIELLEKGRFPYEPRGDPSQPTNDQLYSPSVNNDVIMNDAQNIVGVRIEPVVQVLEQSNVERDYLSVDAGRTLVGVQGMEQGGEEGRVCSHLDMENTGEGSAQHVDRTVPPMIDENYNRREATERLVQHSVDASSFVVSGNHNAISTTPQEQNNEVDNVAGDAGTVPAVETMAHAPGRSVEEYMRSLEAYLLENDINNGTGGVVQPGTIILSGCLLEDHVMMVATLATRSPSTDVECFSVTGDDPTVVEIITVNYFGSRPDC